MITIIILILIEKKEKKNWSYGIICVSKEGYMIINKSPPYIKSRIRKSNKKNSKNNFFGYISLNTNEKYNLTLGMFPNTTLEGEYTLPKGKMDDIDKKNSIYTKVREFIEETKLIHKDFSTILNQHFIDPNFKSFLNDEKFIIKESWIGLNGIIYYCEYSVFVIKSMNELVPINLNNNNDKAIVPFNYFLNNFSIYKNCNRYHKKYLKSSNLDRQKTTVIVPIPRAVQLLNEHKINNNNDNADSRIQLKDIMKILISTT